MVIQMDGLRVRVKWMAMVDNDREVCPVMDYL
jgi:hypothetical protein